MFFYDKIITSLTCHILLSPNVLSLLLSVHVLCIFPRLSVCVCVCVCVLRAGHGLARKTRTWHFVFCGLRHTRMVEFSSLRRLLDSALHARTSLLLMPLFSFSRLRSGVCVCCVQGMHGLEGKDRRELGFLCLCPFLDTES